MRLRIVKLIVNCELYCESMNSEWVDLERRRWNGDARVGGAGRKIRRLLADCWSSRKRSASTRTFATSPGASPQPGSSRSRRTCFIGRRRDSRGATPIFLPPCRTCRRSPCPVSRRTSGRHTDGSSAPGSPATRRRSGTASAGGSRSSPTPPCRSRRRLPTTAATSRRCSAGPATCPGRSLFFWGGLDHHIPEDQRRAVIEAVGEAGKPFVDVVFSDADHGFFCDARASYQPAAAAQAWSLTHAFFDTYCPRP